ncbi:hypothetical protein CSAL01_03686 [Colletotrichum salicis]|uniref:Uncharacterized protein n=1 Tax=Colletotrichum salicis TaxID=1209931 RepID=A0A135V2M4_9PEZI|nr:hypothetical protein CSAL01_03686 [Colletotrichum salicis]
MIHMAIKRGWTFDSAVGRDIRSRRRRGQPAALYQPYAHGVPDMLSAGSGYLTALLEDMMEGNEIESPAGYGILATCSVPDGGEDLRDGAGVGHHMIGYTSETFEIAA